jgi:amino acid permease
MSTGTKVLIGVLVFFALIAFAVGLIYLTAPAAKLPEFLGRIPHAHYHRTKRGGAAIVLGILLLVVSFVVGFAGRRSRAPQLPAAE